MKDFPLKSPGRSVAVATTMILALIFIGNFPNAAAARPAAFNSAVTLTTHGKVQTAKFQTPTKMHNNHVQKLSAASPGFAKLSKSLEKWAAADPNLKLKDIKISYNTPLKGTAFTRFKATIREFVATKWASLHNYGGGSCH